MALPKLNVPRYKIKLPSDGRTVSFRPFLVKEEKLLLLATETGEQDEIVTAIKNIIKECTDIQNVERLSTFDIEYLFLQIRTKSVGESVDVTVICPDDGESEVAISIPLDDIKVVKTRGHKREMKLSDEIVITMGYPSLDTFVKMNFTDSDSEVEQMFDMAASCVETIADVEQVYECKDVPKAELIEWFNELNSKQFQMIQKFFETMPKLSHTVMVTNPNTGVESEVVLEGLASFFA
ncbi:baseplate hub subunit [Synechococcus phage S-RIM2]|uniref:Baseplate hub subunit n=1 Tax=Synechococcus phage S-RIM2 TaxID=687800 RepID=A0A1D7RM95_9CAUD|nr:baseplate hub subunit [Synechococcus phage S-RIM2]